MTTNQFRNLIWRNLDSTIFPLFAEILLEYKIGYILNNDETLLQSLLVKGKKYVLLRLFHFDLHRTITHSNSVIGITNTLTRSLERFTSRRSLHAPTILSPSSSSMFVSRNSIRLSPSAPTRQVSEESSADVTPSSSMGSAGAPPSPLMPTSMDNTALRPTSEESSTTSTPRDPTTGPTSTKKMMFHILKSPDDDNGDVTIGADVTDTSTDANQEIGSGGLLIPMLLPNVSLRIHLS